jgi:hypothetical protein
MTCPKCKTIQLGNFCGECGKKLKDLCPDGCGRMEQVDRPVCDTKLETVRKEMDSYCQQKICYIKWLLIFYFAMIVISGLLLVIHAKTQDDWPGSSGILDRVVFMPLSDDWKAILLVCGFVAVSFTIPMIPLWVINWLEGKKRKEAKREFLEINPDKAEILKKAKEK